MVDNPKTFITIVVTIVVILVVIVAGFRLSSQDSDSTATTTAETATPSEKTTEKTSRTDTRTQTPAKTPTGPVAYDVIISYTNQGFIPDSIEIEAGTAVRFINKSDGAMRVWSVENTNAPNYYADLKQSGSVGKGGIFDFTFPYEGIWLYQNLNDTSKVGVVTVK